MERFAGLDVHKDSVQVCVIDGKGKVVNEERYPTTPVGLNALLLAVMGCNCVMEASTAAYRIYDYLKERKVEVRVGHPKRIKAISSTKIKTDKVDAEILAKLERADLIPESHIPDKDVRSKRDLIKHHVQLRTQMTRINNKLKALLLRHDIKIGCDLFTKRAGKLIEATDMPEHVKLMLSHGRKEYALFKEEFKEVDKRITELAKKNADAVLLQSIPGVGWFSALVIATQIDGIERFPTVDHLISYAGLCPSVKQSGEKTCRGGTGRDNNKLLRWILVQDSWVAVRHSKRFKKLYGKLSRRKGKQKAIVGVAKRLLSVIYSMLRNRTSFNPMAGM